MCKNYFQSIFACLISGFSEHKRLEEQFYTSACQITAPTPLQQKMFNTFSPKMFNNLLKPFTDIKTILHDYDGLFITFQELILTPNVLL